MPPPRAGRCAPARRGRRSRCRSRWRCSAPRTARRGCRARREWIELALTVSDNPAAASLYASLGADAAAAVADVLRSFGDDTTVVATRGRDGWSTYGQTRWSLVEQHRFMTALAAADDRSSLHVLDLIGRVTSDRWGLGAVGAVCWKGGWGPEADGTYLVRQMGVVGDGRVVALMARAADGRFVTGQALATDLARQVVA